jgi:hypothetical protein
MRRRVEPFKRLGERLHPAEHAERCPKTAAAFAVIRDRLPFVSFNSRVEKALATGDVDGAAQALEARPGEYARRLDVLLRKSSEPQALLQRFAALAPRVSTAVLLQVLAHFKVRAEEGRLRVFFPKGEGPCSSTPCTANTFLARSMPTKTMAMGSPFGMS